MMRDVQPGEVSQFVELGREFFAEAQIPWGFSPEAFCASWEQMLRMDSPAFKAVFIGLWLQSQPIGAIGGVVTEDNLSGDRMAVEQFWFVGKDHRCHGETLLEAFEDRAKELGAKRVLMMHLESLNPRIMERFYRRHGYHLLEQTFWKEVR